MRNGIHRIAVAEKDCGKHVGHRLAVPCCLRGMNAPVDANFGRLSHVNEPKRHQMLAKDLGRLRSIIPSDFTKAATCRDEAGGYAQR